MGENISSIIELAKLAASRHDERRKYEWTVSFAFWGLIIGAIAKKSNLPPIFPFVGIIIIVLYAMFWIRGVWVANENDKNLSWYFIKEATSSLMNPNYQFSKFPPPRITYKSLKFWFGFLRDWAMQFHLLVTILVVWTFFIFR